MIHTKLRVDKVGREHSSIVEQLSVSLYMCVCVCVCVCEGVCVIRHLHVEASSNLLTNIPPPV